ncbi:anion permease [Kocuria rhizophila]|nr:anion permease [Kocuria rhizophila]
MSLAAVPVAAHGAHPPTPESTPKQAPTTARSELQKMGSMTRGEIIMAATSALLLLLWASARPSGVNATHGGLRRHRGAGLVTKVLTWNDMAKTAPPWNTTSSRSWWAWRRT